MGAVCAVWLAHILLRADHRLNQVRAWADQLQATLASFLPAPVRPTDLTDDRLDDVLRALSHDTRWAAYEGAVNGHLLRVYDLHPTTVRVVWAGGSTPPTAHPTSSAWSRQSWPIATNIWSSAAWADSKARPSRCDPSI